MSQDTTTVNDLIVNAYYWLGEISPDTIPEPAEVNRGLYLLNQLIDYFSGLGVYIGIVKQFNVTLTPNKAIYTVSDQVGADFNFNRIVELDFVNIILSNGGNWAVRIIDRAMLLNHYTYTKFNQLPSSVYLDKFARESKLTFYPAPDLAYITQIRAKVMLNRLALFEVITEVPPHYYYFMQLALAKRLSFYYPGRWDADKEAELSLVRKELKAASVVNLTTKPSSILSQPYGTYGAYGIYPWGPFVGGF
jgi:hypothetical protein